MPEKVAVNPHHIYQIGMLFTCLCRKSRMWTNSVRSVPMLLKYFNAEIPKYFKGFCSDEFCGYCGGYTKTMENGVKFQGKEIDRYGCPNCIQNQDILSNNFDKTPEEDTVWLIDWYSKHLGEIKSPVKLL